MNLKEMRSALMFIIMTAIFTGGKSQNNFNNPTDFRLSTKYMIPMHYNVELIFLDRDLDDTSKKIPSFVSDSHNSVFLGTSNITINILQSTRSITLHMLNLYPTYSAKLITKDGIIYTESMNIQNYTTNIRVFNFDDILFPGLYQFNIKFNSETTYDNTKGFFRTYHVNKNGNSTWMFATHIQTIGARRLFPCWDDPQLRATFNITIKHPNNSTALSNMPILVQDRFGDYLKVTYFHTTPPISTYHNAIAVTNYVSTRINENTFLWCRENFVEDSVIDFNNFGFAMRVIKNVTSHLASEFKRIEIPKLDHVAIPNFPQDDTSNWGLIFYRETDLIYDKSIDDDMHKIEIARCIAFKIAYQWFGNVVSPSRWSSFWLHSGLAILFGEEAIAKVFNNSMIMDFFIVQNQYESLHLDSHFDMNPPQITNPSEINSLYNLPRYTKVPIVLRMFQDATEFKDIIHEYLYKHMFNSVTFREFWLTQYDIYVTYQFFYTVPEEFLTWLSYKHYPVLNWTIDGPFNGNLTQTFNISNYGKWWIEIVIKKPRLPYVSAVSWLDSQTPYYTYKSLNINPLLGNTVECIIIDIRQAGYYRINYDDESHNKIVSFLNSIDYKNIHVINRAKIIDDAFHLTIAHQLDFDKFWQLTSYLQNETDYVAWYPMIKVFEYASNMIPFYEHYMNSTFENTFKKELENLLIGTFETLRNKDLPENVFLNSLKQEIFKWTCMLKYGPCLAMAKEKLFGHFDSFNSNLLLPGWKKWTYCNGLQTASLLQWHSVYIKIRNYYELAPYLVCTRNSSIILERFSDVLWFSRSIVDGAKSSHINIYHSLVAKHANDFSIVTNFLLEFELSVPRPISRIAALTDIVNHVYSEELLDKILNEVEKHQYITDQQFSKLKHKINLRVSQIRKQINVGLYN